MVPNIVFQPISIETSTADTDGRLVLVDGRLAALLIRLQDEMHPEDLRGAWFVEAAFGALSEEAGTASFTTLEEAADWIKRRLSGSWPPSGSSTTSAWFAAAFVELWRALLA
jgi:hypothetical protein